ncbi:peptidylprolyl isomerase [Candidatus Woesearchaeota archaeon]|nr:peptidylprolyl isomerase [Candidatus Woesearchaeota archaeon]
MAKKNENNTDNKSTNNRSVEAGSKVSVEYTGTFDNGEKFDSSDGREPLKFEVDAKQVIKGFNDAVKGMKLNEEKTIRIEPKEGYGEPNPALVRDVPKNKLPENLEPKIGMVLSLQSPEGKTFGARICEVNKDTFKIDLNHPLAGKALNFRIKVVAIE